jgi:hypothetical protein
VLTDNVPKTKVKARRVKPTVVKPPAGDVASSGGDYGMPEAKQGARTKQVRQDTAAVYADQPATRKKAILRNATGTTGATVRKVHAKRVARDQEIAASAATKDTKGDTERGRADAYKNTPAYLDAVKASSADRQKPLSGVDAANRTTAVVRFETGADRPRSDDELRRFLATGERPTRTGSKESLREENQGLPVQLLRRTVDDYVDTTANAVPGMYHLATTAVTDPKLAAKELAQPYIDTAKHPIKSFVEHPGNTALLFAGGEGALGHGVGKALRTAPAKRLRKVGSTAREVESPGNIAAVDRKPYSKNFNHKAAQVSVEKIKARRARKQGAPAPKREMSEKDIERRVDESVAVGRTVAGHNEAKAQNAAKKALGKKPSAATSAIAQGLADGSVADLQALIGHYRTRAASLTGDSLKRNQETVAALEDALKSHDPSRAVAAAKAYSDMRAPGEAEMVAGGFVKPEIAEATRLAGVAVRRHNVQTGAEAPKLARQAAKADRKASAKDLRKARRKAAGPDTRAVTTAKVKLGQATSRARGNAARRRATILDGDVGKTLGSTKAQRVTAYIKAVEEGDRPTMLRLASQETADKAAVKAARGDVKAAKAAKRTGPQAARAAAESARRAHIDVKTGIKAGAYVGPDGKLIPLDVVRNSKGPVEPVYVSHSPTGDVRPAAVPTELPAMAVKEARTGKALDEGTIDLHPDRLIKQAGDSQRRLDAAKNYDRFLDTFSHRKAKGASPEIYGSEGTADAAALTLRDSTDIDWVKARTSDGNYQLVPQAAARRLASHAAHNDNLMAGFTRQWSKNVLAFSPRWLAGQLIEPVVRATVAHAGPRSIATGVKVARRIKEEHGQAAADQFKATTMSSGLQRAAMAPLEHVGARKEYTGLAKTVRELPKKPGPKQLGQVYNAVTNFTMGTLNHLVQNPSQYAMLGKAIRDSDLMSEHTVKLSNAAIDDFVRNGGKDINVMSALGREVTRMNGKYSGFSPKVQAAIAGYTPFLAWTLSATNFLFNVMPRDHPVLTSLIASSNEATEAWRKANGLNFDPFAKGQEGWLQGSIPGKDGSHLRVGRYVPFGLADDDVPILGPYAEAILPQAMGIVTAVKEGEDFTGRSLTDGSEPSAGRKVAAGASLFLRGIVPLASQVLAVGGVRTPDMADSAKIKPKVKARLRAQFDPFMYTPGTGGGGEEIVKPVRARRVRGAVPPPPPPVVVRRLPPPPPPPRRH